MGNKLKFSITLKTTPALNKLVYLWVNFGYKKAKTEEQLLKKVRGGKDLLEDMAAAPNDEDYLHHFASRKSLLLYGVKPKDKLTYKPINLSTKLSCPVAFFDKKTRLFKKEYEHYNKKIEDLKTSIQLLYDSIVEVKPVDEITNEYFRKEIENHIFSNKGNTPANYQVKIQAKDKAIQVTVLKQKQLQVESNVQQIVKQNKVFTKAPDIFTDYITYVHNKYKRKSKPPSKGTLINWIKFKNWILKFEQDELNKEKILLSELSTPLAEMFLEYVKHSKKPNGKPYSLNYHSWFIACLKKFVNEATTEDDMILPSINVEKKTFKKETEKVDDISLTLSQLETLRKGAAGLKKAHQKVVDVFLILCNAAIRKSDYDWLDLIKEGNEYYFLSTNIKTDAKVKVPVFENYIIDIYNKYNQTLPTLSDQYLNDEIKKVFKELGFTQLISKHYYDISISEKQKIKVPLYEMISSKTGRKTFASNIIRMYKVPLQVGQSWLGHTTEKSFREYLRLTAQEYAEISMRAMQEYNKIRKAS